ncbi:hypothetical protein K439DRAFT_1662863 [Ramaria rubella]|nr:hypothetical protein K439DRAFT_1662863 [Ramaria rubella]
MSTEPTRPSRGRGRGRGGLGKYLRARGRRGTGLPAEFGKRLVLESEEQNDESGSEDNDEEHAAGNKYARRQLGTNADRYEEPEVDPHEEQEPEPEVDLTIFLAKQRLTDQESRKPYVEIGIDDGIDHSLSNFHFTSSSAPNPRKNKTEIIEWDASMDELKREKNAAEAAWDLKSRFRKHQPRLAFSSTKLSPCRDTRPPSKIEDSRHAFKTPSHDTNTRPNDSDTNKADLEDFLDDLLS